MLGALVGLTAEAKILRDVFPAMPVAVSGATEAGARKGVAALRRNGATALLSFGCAAGLKPELGPGAILVPEWVESGGRRHEADPGLRRRFGAGRPGVVGGGMVHSPVIVATAAEKAALALRSGGAAVDMESGVVAESGLPFGVLRVVCDDAARDLPPVARDVLAGGRISPWRLMAGLARAPGQIGGLIALGRDAARARREIARFLRSVEMDSNRDIAGG
ncbi:phosphorylase family protein [Acidomonas methanolica]|uniref:Uncharacterized protein n=1 Tax=Acidomonas methanolica NBRC 104435 TaxID=1231351 RepID=A0A023D0G8_ACIMT|nr:hypothetical protein [Acidomonas methanolica]MBU2653916.1 hypothetical protein [Acidomonas methanolica]TCS30876.1 phosphorylase superfamily protein [Acidomonas methanolica]GAJ27559.1 hypothetical protein Amme_002_002 [Acidomonas methanolica NBRC 104435]GEK98327.1 purine phosphorylase [Acidomonas methanolica NBRC 104435]